MKFAIGRRNKCLKESLDIIHDYIYDLHGQAIDLEFYSTIFPRPEMNEYALSKKVER